MDRNKSVKLEMVDLILMTAITYMGFHLFFFIWYGAADSYSNPIITYLMSFFLGANEGFANAWTKRLFMIGALGIVSAASLFVINDVRDSIKIFIVTWVVLVACMFIAGGGYAVYDARGTFDANNAWLAFDAGDFALGVNFQLITNSAVVIMALGALALILFQVNYAEEGTEQIKAILKGVVSAGFLYLFYTQIFPIVM